MHASIFVNAMASSIEFSTTKLGLNLRRGPVHYPGNADMVFVGRDWNAYIELAYDLEHHAPYELSDRLKHLAFDVEDDLIAVIESLHAAGVKVLSGPRQSPAGNRLIAFVEDPNGIPIELLEYSDHPGA